jgi:hypothetical protein
MKWDDLSNKLNKHGDIMHTTPKMGWFAPFLPVKPPFLKSNCVGLKLLTHCGLRNLWSTCST